MEPKIYPITKIEMGHCSQQEFFWAGNGIKVMSLYYDEEMCIAPGAELKVVEKVNKKEVIRTITLSFSTSNEMPKEGFLSQRSFRVITPEGVFLIGNNKVPYPITSAQRVYGGRPTGNKMYQISVMWTINKPLPMIEQ